MSNGLKIKYALFFIGVVLFFINLILANSKP